VPAGTRSTSSPGLTAQQFQHELRKSLFAIRQRYLIDQHTLYSSGSLHGGGDANVRALPPTSNAAQRLSATSNADTLRSVLRDETCTSHNLPPSCKQRMLRGFDAAQHRHRHRDPSRRVQRMTCMAQTHPHSRVSTPRRLSSQTQVAVCEINKHTPPLISRARFLHRIPHYRAAMAGRNSKTADDDTLYKHQVVGTLFGLAMLSLDDWRKQCLRRRWCFQTRLDCAVRPCGGHTRLLRLLLPG
jgi:hypothetical protein